MTIHYVTKNAYKVYMTKLFMQKYGIDVHQIAMETPELQEDDCEKVATYSSQYAFEKVGLPVLKNDGGLHIRALHNFPAAYTKYAEATLGENGILKLMEGQTDRYAYWLEALAYTDQDGTKVFLCKTEGTIATEKSGTYGWGYDRIFIPKGQTKTLANFEDEPRGLLWNQNGYEDLAAFLKQKQHLDNKQNHW